MNLDRALATQPDTLLVGVDGGASGFRAFEIVVRDAESRLRLSLGPRSAAEPIEPVANFAAKPLEAQRDEARRSSFACTPEERTLRGRWIQAASRAIRQVAAATGHASVLVGVCAPGVKTADGRGIELSLNGPRIPDFVDALEQSLLLDGVNLARPIRRVISDGLACGLGEDLADGGLFADLEHAYYLGGGSGVAEAYKLNAKVLSSDDMGAKFEKAWQLRAADGDNFETHLSVSGLNRAFGLDDAAAAAPQALPENAAAAGDPRAILLFAERAERLAELCCARLVALFEARDVILERIVVGQRLGAFFLDPRLEHCFAAPARAALAARLAECAPPRLREAWLEAGRVRSGRLLGSNLRAAPALGALALALARD